MLIAVSGWIECCLASDYKNWCAQKFTVQSCDSPSVRKLVSPCVLHASIYRPMWYTALALLHARSWWAFALWVTCVLSASCALPRRLVSWASHLSLICVSIGHVWCVLHILHLSLSFTLSLSLSPPSLPLSSLSLSFPQSLLYSWRIVIWDSVGLQSFSACDNTTWDNWIFFKLFAKDILEFVCQNLGKKMGLWIHCAICSCAKKKNKQKTPKSFAPTRPKRWTLSSCLPTNLLTCLPVHGK